MTNDLAEIKALLLDLKKDVQHLKDVEELERLIVSYARGCDRGNDPVMIAPLFSEDGTWECKGFGKYEGRRNVAGGLHGIAGEKIWWSLHYMISPQIDVAPDGQTAKGFWYLWEAATIPNEHSGEAEPYWIGATYDTDMKKLGGKWYFSRMELILNMASPASENWVKKRFPDGTKTQPYFETLEPGTYHWCACGKSKTQPYCDGSHKTTKRVPVEFTVDKKQDLVLCGCKMTKTGPLCDGAHLNIRL